MLSSLPMPAGEGQRVGTLTLICCPRISGARAIFVGRTGKIVGMAIGQKADDMPKKLTIKRDNTIANRRPDLLEEWDWEKNAELGLDPYVLTCGSGKTVWWKCKACGHEYKAFPYSRNSGSGCPECAKSSRGKSGHDKLSVERPDLAAEWHTEKNGDLTPDDVTAGSERKVWWVCPLGHEYDAQVKARTKGGTGCPVCAGKRVLKGFNDLASRNPSLASEWHPKRNGDLTPDMVAYMTHRKVWWICYNHDEPYEWEAAVNNRARGGCPQCGTIRSTAAHEVPSKGESLAEVSPRIASEWHPTKNGSVTPRDVKGRSGKHVWWRCETCGREWKASIASRVRQDSGCAVCSGKELLAGVNDLDTTHPDIARSWHPTKNGTLTPRDVTAYTKKRVWWLGDCGHSWKANVSGRVCGNGCPECWKRYRTSFPEKALFYYVLMYFSDATENARPDVRGLGQMEFDIWVPSANTAIEYDGEHWHDDVERDAAKDLVCRNGGIKMVRVRESGCPPYDDMYATVIVRDMSAGLQSLNTVISQTLSELGVAVACDVDVAACEQQISGLVRTSVVSNSLGATSEVLASEWCYEKNGDLTPFLFKPFSAQKVWWNCPNGHEPYLARILSRSSGSGCPTCAANTRREKLMRPKAGNSLEERHPDIASEWHPTLNGDLRPSDVNRGSARKVWWLCACGNVYIAAISSRTSKGSGCPKCGYRTISLKARKRWAEKKGNANS